TCGDVLCELCRGRARDQLALSEDAAHGPSQDGALRGLDARGAPREAFGPPAERFVFLPAAFGRSCARNGLETPQAASPIDAEIDGVRRRWPLVLRRALSLLKVRAVPLPLTSGMRACS